MMGNLLNAQTQTQIQKAPPKIGLVLSGGGAKGIAHVGVLKAMEKAGIRPDYIVGTSMGAVIGGLYAIGYNADELETIINTVNWDLIISNRVNFNNIAFEEKEYYNRYLLELPIVDKKITVPTGLIEGQKLSETLHYYTWPANQYKTFDEFPIPFRCIATDLRNGKDLVFKSGYLADAIRSSLAIPTAFTPFDLDSTIVVDGGVVNNFPVDEAKKMGAEIIIGVNVGDEGFLSPEKLGSFSSILMQIAMSTSNSKLQQNINDCDIYIKPDLKGNSTSSFSNYKEILQLGKISGEANFQKLKQLADSLNIKDINHGISLKVKPIIITDIQIEDNRLFSDQLIISKLDIAPNDTVSRPELREGIQRIFGMNGFKKVDYRLVPENNDHFKLLIKTKEKTEAVISSAFHYDNLFSAGFLLNLTVRDLFGRQTRTVGIADISENPKFRIDHYKYLGNKKRYALNLRYDYLSQQIPEYENGKSTDININRNTNVHANILSTHSLKSSIAFGAFYEKIRSRSKFDISIPSEVKSGSFSSYGIRFIYNKNSLNNRNFPTKGLETILETKFNLYNHYKIKLDNGIDTLTLDLDGEPIKIPKELLDQVIDDITPSSYLSLYFSHIRYSALHPKFQLISNIATGITISDESRQKSFNEFQVGGFQKVEFNDTRAWGYNYAEVDSPNFFTLGVSPQYTPVKNLYIRTGLSIIGLHQHIPINEMKIDSIFHEEFLFGYGIDASLNSFLGPITVGISSNTNDDKLRAYFSLGYSFNYSDR
ncbi:patatin-like phospholipase family protein [Echinicola salinicaeni]|uniref:patatin-like phospholipase family protein n=1 Tax=Echinicola salinicaeni TaxID=2762757 RepID=UPI001E6053C7|nr:patatin-like phospholipase family protein [Echinicola salinicaeni]